MKRMPVEIEDIYPLSPVQEGMLFHTLHAPTSGVYFEQIDCTLEGHLDISIFKRTWQRLIERHPILRTAFNWEDFDQMMQIVHRRVELPWQQHDWQGVPPGEQQERLLALLEEERSQGFDLTQAPVIRLVLIQLSQDTYHFVWNFHHLLSDGWSGPRLLRELFTFYNAFSQGQNLHLERPRPYRDYIAWLKEQDLAAAQAFWEKNLKGFTTPSSLPHGHPQTQPAEQLATAHLHLDPATSKELRTLVKKHQLTMNSLVTGAWAILLGHYNHCDDVAFGATVSGRPAALAGVEKMIGPFINTLPMRVRVEANEPLLPWLQSLQAQQLELRQFEYSPLVLVQKWADIPPTSPLFTTILVFDNYPTNVALAEVDDQTQLNASRLTVRNVRSFERTNYPLTVTAHSGSVLMLRINYDTSQFSHNDIQRILGHWETLLTGVATDPHRTLANLRILTSVEQQQLTETWNQTNVSYPAGACLPELFTNQVEKTPEAIAVVFDDQHLTYRELNRRANQLAHYLQELGVGPEKCVAICMERSPETLLALLGVLKAGGVYLPLDPGHPPKRLAFMLADANTAVLITQQHLTNQLPITNNQLHIIRLDADWPEVAQSSQANPHPNLTPANLAYNIYTSGSTGTPKGVMIQHGAVVNLVTALHHTVYTGQNDKQRISLNAPLSFDSSVKQWAQLLYGHTICIVPEEVRPDGTALLQFVTRHNLDVLDCTPAQLRLMLAANSAGSRLMMPKLALIGGEAIDAATWTALQECHDTHFFNVYGPTECTVDATAAIVQETVTEPIIGRPLHNVHIYLLDQNLKPVPIGVPGEICVGGVGLARGYFNDAPRSAARFIPNPFGDLPGKRLYRTGDLGRYLPDGNIEFLGRVDSQVKIRGFRIELGEIEAILNQHTAVRECIVLAQKDDAEHGQLVAYMRPRQETPPSARQLRTFLQQHLPDYMLPAFFVWLETWPLLSNGKVDRQALPAHTATLETSTALARNPIEELLLNTWKEVLPVHSAGIHDNFFELGGHSLLATQLISRIRTVLGVEIPLRHLFEAPTVAQFAPLVTAALKVEHELPIPPLLPLADDAPPPLSFAQQRLWFLDQLQPESPAYNVPLAVRLSGQLDIPSLQQALSEVSRRHQVLRTVFPSVDGRPLQKVLPAQPFALPVADLGHLPQAAREAEAHRLAALASNRTFSLASGPLWSVWLLQLDAADFVVLLTMHHIITDGWSMNLFIRELAALYQAYHDQQPSPLPQLPLQYADFAAWQRGWLQDEVLDNQLRYWHQQLAGSPTLLALPTDFPRPAVQSNRGASLPVSLPHALTLDLIQLSRAEGVTLFMTLLAAFKLLLFRYAHQPDIVVGTPIAGRNFAEIEPLIGFFVNTLVLRSDLSGNPSFRQLLPRVRHTALAAYSHQDLPFEKLVEALQPERSLSHAPLFQVMFAWQTVAQPAALSLPHLRLSPWATENRTAKFDLSLSLAQDGDHLGGVLEYNRDLFTAATIQRMINHFFILLEETIADPDRPITQIPLLSPAERQQLLLDWNDTGAPYPQEQGIHELFAAQAARTPDVIAVSYQEQQLTYGQLNRRANQLAHYLRRLGVGPGVPVGLSVERSPAMIVALLGILKAGGAYLPLDPTYPQSRLAFMIGDAQLAVLLTLEYLVDTLPGHKAQLICLDSDWPLIARESDENPPRGTTADNLAYIIYTSGSTGQPKGVMVPHRGLVNVAQAQANQFDLSTADRILQFSSLNFDASISEILMALTAGATLCLGDRDELLPGPRLAQFMQDRCISIATLTPSTLAALPPSRLRHLHTITVAGEACTATLVSQWATEQRFFNLYGPTEASIWATAAVCQPDGQMPSIGQPIPNTQAYVLDTHLQPLPVGIPGQLLLGGVGVSWGYWQQPALTAEKFIPHPFSQQPGARLYKTGDLVRYLPDANLEFLGRIDHQVKLRGFRIELGEIESILNRHPLVQETVVVAHDDHHESSNRYLVAYLVTDAPINDIRDFLRHRLPDYMIPAHFITLDKLPLTPNGKVDRQALPKPGLERPETTTSYTAPRTPTEVAIAEIWAQVLHLEQVGIYDDFFELGGHSLLATQIISRVREAFQIELPLRRLFEIKAVAGLAELVVAQKLEKAESSDLQNILVAVDELSDEEVALLLSTDGEQTNRL